MAEATLSRGGTSVDIQLEEESGEILLSATFGKPNLNVRESGGTINPRTIDNWSGLENYQLVGKLYDYGTTHELADLVKSGSTDPLTLEIPQAAYPDSITVAPSAGSDSALSLSYPAGKRNVVDVELTLTRVGDVLGVGEQPATTPTASGSGPVEVRVNGTAVALPTAGLSVERVVGRPNDAVRRDLGADPRYEVKTKVANDVFTFSFETVENIPATLNALTDNIFRERLGRDGVTVDFNGVLGLGEITAVPTGSSPFRQVHQAGQGWVSNPVLEFRRIFTPE
jgi:hypothetical protein